MRRKRWFLIFSFEKKSMLMVNGVNGKLTRLHGIHTRLLNYPFTEENDDYYSRKILKRLYGTQNGRKRWQRPVTQHYNSLKYTA